MMWAGRHLQSPISILDLILPSIENGSVLVAGEIEPEACDQVLRRVPRLKAVLDLIKIDPLPTAPTLQLARSVVKDLEGDGVKPTPEPVISEALKLSDQYLGRDLSPGGVLDLLKRTIETKAVSGSGDEPLSSRDLQRTLSGLTGLPSVILDEKELLDIDILRDFFESRILGQPEAVQCLVDRVAMIKAGLTDPTRPLGVFLFAGPTGTGKTELAKALAGFLFGSADRMLRLDMSEFQTSDSLSRILGDTRHDFDQEALADRIRNQPFAVVLLDEFEKAHERIWDVFLQLFDDGRLTDHHGNTADFRHAIVIMTTNLGSQNSRSIGFLPQPEQTIRPALETAFKKEFINRIDQIVVFRALTRAVMRDILMKELGEALDRRGLRTRQWAVEWEPSAIDFLLSKGFTDDLGARPLKRSIERYVLSPLAATIVDHQYPEGDQFLFVRSDGESIEVAFVDPDEPEEYEEVEAGQPVTASEPLHVRDIVLSPRGESGELIFLKHQYEQLVQKVENETWSGMKNSLIESMNNPGFWGSQERYRILGKAEYMDRIEEGLRTAGSLLERLSGIRGEDRDKFSVSLIRRIAQRIYLVESACSGVDEGEPSDAFVLIEAIGRRTDLTEVNSFAGKLQSMYRQWAKHREMQCILMTPDSEGAGGHFRTILAVSGFAAFPILKPEHGIHEMAITGKRGQTIHLRTRVLVTPQPDEPVHGRNDPLLRQAEESFSLVETENLKVVRRYREEPSPLVRDSVRQFRTGRIDVIWRGDFDLL
jgi:ATP-dependent Clp protease ATP-binding subunit ClpC